MTTERFLEFYNDHDLSAFLEGCARKFSRNHQSREDLKAWAWAFILEIPRSDMDIEFYRRIAYNAMHVHYRLDRRERACVLEEWMTYGHVNWPAWNQDDTRIDLTEAEVG